MIAPRQKPHVVAQHLLEDKVDVVERCRHVDILRLQGRKLGVRRDIDPAHRFGIHAGRFRQGRPHLARRIPGRVPDFPPREILDGFDPGTFQPVHAIGRIGIDVHHADDIRPLALCHKRGAEIGNTKFVLPDADALGRHRRALALLDRQIDTGFFIDTLRLRPINWCMIAAGDPVEDEIDLFGALGRHGHQSNGGGGGCRQKCLFEHRFSPLF